MTPKERELLRGMGNCYAACGADFKQTVKMVAGARGRTAEDVEATLAEINAKYRTDPDYVDLRKRLPVEFPL